ncbi:hypothetical protein [Halobacteriovorax sp. HLS]|uniref:hypothetical protein n=1 Tax=Halobacteriovorax sp. HLS TaxID=2234000 RepID=UPI000FDBB982|nr:hypothetical protein [Halobacteriovorax sp. HLS]
MTRRMGYCRIISMLLLIISTKGIYALQSFTCENTLNKNGELGAFSKNQHVIKNKGRDLSTFYIETENSKKFFNKGSWYWSDESTGLKRINLIELSNKLKLKDPNFQIRYNHKSLQRLEVSPILKNSKNSFFPNITIELLNNNLFAHKSETLPKSLKAINSSNYYIEYSEKFLIPTRIIYVLNSAFINESLMCQKVADRKLNIPALRNYVDLTNSPKDWPKELDALKDSIAVLIIESILKKKNDISIIEKFSDYLNRDNLYEVLLDRSLNLENHSKSVLESIISSFNFSGAKEEKGNLAYVDQVSIDEVSLANMDIDHSKLADDKDSIKINKYINKKVLTQVELTKINETNQFFFYFKSMDFDKLIKVGPFNFKSIYWQKSKKNISSCTQRVKRHLSEYERKSFVFKRNNFSELQVDKILFERDNRRFPLEEFIITNNCRGAGNFEFEWPGIIKSNFHVPVSVVNSILDQTPYYTEERMSKFYDQGKLISNFGFNLKDFTVSLWSNFKEDEYSWKSIGSFSKATDNCSIEKIKNDYLDKEVNFKEVKFKYDLGRIEYDQFPSETRKKSGYNSFKTPIIYVKTPCNDKELKKLGPPKHFFPPKPHYLSNSLKYWEKKTCSIVPINFFYYEDLIKYQVHLSKFEVDGVYVGQNRKSSPVETTEYDQALLKNEKYRVKYDFSNVYSFTKANIAKSEKDDKLTINLTSKDFNLIIGNISISELRSKIQREKFQSTLRPWQTDNVKGVYKLVGIEPFDLSSYYKDSPIDKHSTFSLFYNSNGEVLNQHDTNIGIEQWFLRVQNGKLVLDLISHERITPVARIILDYKI